MAMFNSKLLNYQRATGFLKAILSCQTRGTYFWNLELFPTINNDQPSLKAAIAAPDTNLGSQMTISIYIGSISTIRIVHYS